MGRPKALDLFCGAGGAAMGLYRAGFEVVGVDIRPQPRYPFTFVQADALTFDLSGFDFVWASPPCLFGSEATPMTHRAKHPNLIPATRERLSASGLPFIIENVENVRRHLINPVMLCGSMFGLRTYRHRYFEINPSLVVMTPPCNHNFRPLLVTTAGSNSRRTGNFKSVKHAPAAYGIDWMTTEDLTQAIPPAYSEYLGRQVVDFLASEKGLGAAA